MAFGFGRKGAGGSAPPPAAAPLDGREWVDRHLAVTDRPGSIEFAQALGLKLFDSAYHAMKDERGVRIEAIVAMLASVGGHLCLTAVLDALRNEGRQPADIGMVVIRGHDGNIYYFGDAPNRLLCEAPQSLVSLVFGAAHQHGAAVSVEMLHDEMKLVAQRAGTAEFLDLDLPGNLSVDSPLVWAHHVTSFVLSSTHGGMTPPFRMPMVIGFALQQAIDTGHQSLDPMTLARIALSCSMRAAKLDPERVRAG